MFLHSSRSSEKTKNFVQFILIQGAVAHVFRVYVKALLILLRGAKEFVDFHKAINCQITTSCQSYLELKRILFNTVVSTSQI